MIQEIKNILYNDVETTNKLRELTKNLPKFPDTREERSGFKEYVMESGTCFAWLLFENDRFGVHDWFNSKGTVFPVHSHPELEIVIVYEGRIEFETDSGNISVGEGEFIGFKSDEQHGAYAPVDTRYITIMIPPSKDYPHKDK